MKIILTGGGTGGHFYPIIAVAGAIYDLVEEERLLAPEIIFVSDSPYDKQALKNANITYKEVYAGKVRNYFSLKNFTDVVKTGLGIFGAT
ncbi:glycosyltransferase, partial [Patescibacteria group bacterium]